MCFGAGHSAHMKKYDAYDTILCVTLHQRIRYVAQTSKLTTVERMSAQQSADGTGTIVYGSLSHHVPPQSSTACRLCTGRATCRVCAHVNVSAGHRPFHPLLPHAQTHFRCLLHHGAAPSNHCTYIPLRKHSCICDIDIVALFSVVCQVFPMCNCLTSHLGSDDWNRLLEEG